jgi:hypothetical protein
MAALALVLVAQSPAGNGLVWRASHEASFRVRVPADWRYRDATYPSDHSTELWTSPHDRASRLKVEVSACVGCVLTQSCILSHRNCRPAPENLVPGRVISKRKLDRWRIRYVARVADSRYPVHGLVAVVHGASEIRGFALARVWTPPSKAGVADAILSSFTPPR